MLFQVYRTLCKGRVKFIQQSKLLFPCKALFLAFDASKTVHHSRKFLFEGHLLLAQKDYRICHMDEYISPVKVSDRITLQ